ncbi:MAG: hypothetical protein HY721_33155 [Planctomycetes bacterium]|nr:hypothetical protein [Planctomycetota bacterium]
MEFLRELLRAAGFQDYAQLRHTFDSEADKRSLFRRLEDAVVHVPPGDWTEFTALRHHEEGVLEKEYGFTCAAGEVELRLLRTEIVDERKEHGSTQANPGSSTADHYSVRLDRVSDDGVLPILSLTDERLKDTYSAVGQAVQDAERAEAERFLVESKELARSLPRRAGELRYSNVRQKGCCCCDPGVWTERSHGPNSTVYSAELDGLCVDVVRSLSLDADEGPVVEFGIKFSRRHPSYRETTLADLLRDEVRNASEIHPIGQVFARSVYDAVTRRKQEYLQEKRKAEVGGEEEGRGSVTPPGATGSEFAPKPGRIRFPWVIRRSALQSIQEPKSPKGSLGNLLEWLELERRD